MKIAIAKKVFTIAYEGSDAAFIAFAETLAEDAIDPDLGDAVGVFTTWAQAQEWEGDDSGEYILAREGIIISISVDWEPFEWDPEKMPGTLMNRIIDNLTRGKDDS